MPHPYFENCQWQRLQGTIKNVCLFCAFWVVALRVVVVDVVRKNVNCVPLVLLLFVVVVRRARARACARKLCAAKACCESDMMYQQWFLLDC